MTMEGPVTDNKILDLTVYRNARRIVQECLPAYMLRLACGCLTRSGAWEVRQDYLEALDAASAAPLRAIKDMAFIQKLALRIERDGTTILGEENLNHRPKVAMVAVCQAILKLVDQGAIKDTGSNGVLISLAVMQEVENGGEHWADVTGADALMNEIIGRARLMGYF